MVYTAVLVCTPHDEATVQTQCANVEDEMSALIVPVSVYRFVECLRTGSTMVPTYTTLIRGRFESVFENTECESASQFLLCGHLELGVDSVVEVYDVRLKS